MNRIKPEAWRVRVALDGEPCRLTLQEDEPVAAEMDLLRTAGYQVEVTPLCARAALAAADADQAPDDVEQSRQLWEAAIAQAAFYVTDHCKDGEFHAEAIMSMPLPKIAARPAPVGAVQARVHSLLESTARNLTGLDKNQLGYEYAKGWNAALRQIGDYVRGGALAPAAPAAPEVSNRTSAKIARVEVANRTTAKIAAVAPAAPTQQAAHHQGDIESNQALANDIGVFEHQQQATPAPGTNDAPAAPIASDITRPASDIAGVASDISEHAKPEPVEQAEGSEREQFEAWARKECEMPPNVPVNWAATWVQSAWEGWQARGQQAGAVDGEDKARMNHIVAKHVMGSSYGGITSLNIIVHGDDYALGGARWAIDCMVERASANQKGE